MFLLPKSSILVSAHTRTHTHTHKINGSVNRMLSTGVNYIMHFKSPLHQQHPECSYYIYMQLVFDPKHTDCDVSNPLL